MTVQLPADRSADNTSWTPLSLDPTTESIVASKLVLLRSYPTTVEATVARTQLAHAGIPAFLENKTLVGNFFSLTTAVGGVKLFVADTVLDAAREALRAAEEDRLRDAAATEQVPAWPCPNCGVSIDGAFDVCWSCGTLRSGEVDPTFEEVARDTREARRFAADPARSAPGADSPPASASSGPPTPTMPRDDGNPYRASLAPLDRTGAAERSDEELADTEEGDEVVLRAWRAAVIGVFFCPPLLTLYSAYLLCVLALSGPAVSRRGSRRYVLAWLVNLAVGVAVASVLAWGR